MMEEQIQIALTAAITWPIALGTLGEGTSTPRGSWFVIGGEVNQTLTVRGPTVSTIQVDVYGKTAAEAVYAAREVVDALHLYAGGPIIRAMLQVPPQDATPEDVGILHRRRMTFSITHRD